MDREGVHGLVGGEDLARTVAVVEVEVDHQHRAAEAAPAGAGDRHRDVVEDTEARAVVAEGVVEAAAEVDRDAAAGERQPGGELGAAGHQALEVEDAVGDLFGHAEAQEAGERRGVVERVEVVGGVHPRDLLERRRPRRVDRALAHQPLGGEEGQDPLAALGVVEHPGQVQLVVAAVDEVDRARPHEPAQTAPAAADRGGEIGHGSLPIETRPRWRPSRRPRAARRRSRPRAGRAQGACVPSGAARRRRARG